MQHVPMCPVCGFHEVGSLKGGTDKYCSATCEGVAHAEHMALCVFDCGAEIDSDTMLCPTCLEFN
jgi:hypothetical protein